MGENKECNYQRAGVSVKTMYNDWTKVFEQVGGTWRSVPDLCVTPNLTRASVVWWRDEEFKGGDRVVNTYK